MQPLSLQAPPAYSTHPSLPSSSRFLAIIVISSSGSLPPFIRIPHGVGVRVLIPSSELSWGREGKGGEGEGRGRRLLSFAFLSLSLSFQSPSPGFPMGIPRLFPQVHSLGVGMRGSSSGLSLAQLFPENGAKLIETLPPLSPHSPVLEDY